jgi:hypothetical protein
MLGFTAAMALGTCLLFGLLPAIRATRIAPAAAMRAGGRGLTAGRERFSLRRALVVTQVSLSLVLLVGALLFVRSLQKLLTTDVGFRPEGIVSVDFDLSQPKYPKDRIRLVCRDLLEQLRTLPGVLSAAEVGFTPVSGSGWDQRAWAEGATGERPDVNFDRAGPGYFRLMGTGLLAGREFDERDTPTSPKVAIVNEAFAKRVFGGANPVGRVFLVEEAAGKPDSRYLVVGLMRNTKYSEIREDFRPIGFFPMSQIDEGQGPGAVLSCECLVRWETYFAGLQRLRRRCIHTLGFGFTCSRNS